MATRIVLAEDEAIIRLDLRETLQEEGYDVVGDVGRGDHAVDLVRELRPDVAIFDIKMPGKSGLEAAYIVTKCTEFINRRDLITYFCFSTVEFGFILSILNQTEILITI